VAKESFKFNAAHFVAFQGFRERLHGHNYTCAVRLLGGRRISSDGYVLDFGDAKAVTKKICKELNEHFLCPMHSDVLDITVERSERGGGKQDVRIVCEDGAVFLFPREDCFMLPIVHATAEEIAIYLWSRILEELHAPTLIKRGIHTMELIVAEAVGQEAVFRYPVPTESECAPLDVASFIMGGDVPVEPCQAAKLSESEIWQSPRKVVTNECCAECGKGASKLEGKLQLLVDSVNEGAVRTCILAGRKCEVEDLKKIMSGTA